MERIKLRVWDKSRRHYFYGCSNVCLDLSGRLMWQFGFNAPDMLSPEESENYVIEQFTGFTDKNGKDIYEGDRIKAKLQGCIEWDDATGQWWSIPDGTRPSCPLHQEAGGVKVIGTVHDTITAESPQPKEVEIDLDRLAHKVHELGSGGQPLDYVDPNDLADALKEAYAKLDIVVKAPEGRE